MTLVDKTGKVISKGDIVTDFRGDQSVVTGWEAPRHAGSTGRVHTSDGSYFPGVYGLKWEDAQ